MDKGRLLKFLTETENGGISKLHKEGYHWFKSVYLPYLGLADLLLPDKMELIADCWYLAGDVSDFNNAPLKAMEYYKKALEYDEDSVVAYREIAHMNLQTGDYQNALKYINIALEKLPDDYDMITDKTEIIDSINYSKEPYLTAHNLVWKLNEKLASEHFDRVIKEVSEIKNPENSILQCLASAYGAKGDEKAYMEVWGQIAESERPYNLDYTDWFYMPEKVFKGIEFWELMLISSIYMEEAEYVFYDSLTDIYGPDMPEAALLNLIAEYQVYLYYSDFESIQKLGLKYPLWEDVQSVQHKKGN
jgi:tetratricopeptide (TPR) repeat protein